jgi:5-methylcytosine-specific restriction endonuclease McrA
MRFELVILFVTGIIMANIYTDGKYVSQLFKYKKYYKMAGVAFGGFVLYWMIKKKPEKAGEMIATSHEYLKYLPVDRSTSNVLTPILDFTRNQNFSSNLEGNATVAGGSAGIMNMLLPNRNQTQENKIMHSGKKGTKRSVSETKKKFVASRQNWKCGDCQEQLNAWFEVDHKVRLEYGGSNHIDNLVALCRDCHGKKTTIENL